MDPVFSTPPVSPIRCLSSQATTWVLERRYTQNNSEPNVIPDALMPGIALITSIAETLMFADLIRFSLTNTLVISQSPLTNTLLVPKSLRQITALDLSYFRTAICKITLSFLCVTALVETVAYGLIFHPFLSNEKENNLHPLVSSSLFTIYWNLKNILCCDGFFHKTHPVHESFARLPQHIFPIGEVLLTRNLFPQYCEEDKFNNVFTRKEDVAYVQEWWTLHIGNPYPEFAELATTILEEIQQSIEQIIDEKINPEKLEECISFFKRHLYNVFPLEIQQNINECDAETISFIAARAVYLYSIGEEKDSTVLPFFQEKTQEFINKYRLTPEVHLSQEEIVKLKKIMLDPQLFATYSEKKSDNLNMIVNKLSGVASEELQGGKKFNECYQMALTGNPNESN